jgi:hypothetical protein
MKLAAVVAVALTSLVLPGCGKEAGRVPFTMPGTGTVSMPLSAGEVSFWTDIDLEYTGDAELAYAIELDQGGTKVATATCNPLGRLHVKESWTETNLGSSHSRRGMGKMDCSVALPAGGATTVKAILAFRLKPATQALRKADLVVKQ